MQLTARLWAKVGEKPPRCLDFVDCLDLFQGVFLCLQAGLVQCAWPRNNKRDTSELGLLPLLKCLTAWKLLQCECVNNWAMLDKKIKEKPLEFWGRFHQAEQRLCLLFHLKGFSSRCRCSGCFLGRALSLQFQLVHCCLPDVNRASPVLANWQIPSSDIYRYLQILFLIHCDPGVQPAPRGPVERS